MFGVVPATVMVMSPAQLYRWVVADDCAALAPNPSKNVVTPSVMVRSGCGVCVAPCTSCTDTESNSHHLPRGTVTLHSALAAGFVPVTTLPTERLEGAPGGIPEASLSLPSRRYGAGGARECDASLPAPPRPSRLRSARGHPRVRNTAGSGGRARALPAHASRPCEPRLGRRRPRPNTSP